MGLFLDNFAKKIQMAFHLRANSVSLSGFNIKRVNFYRQLFARGWVKIIFNVLFLPARKRDEVELFFGTYLVVFDSFL